MDAKTLVTHATTGSGPSASFLGSDMRAAYYGGTALTGAGQNLGLFEYLGTDLADLTTYYKNAKQTNNVPITLLSTDGTSTSCVYSRAGGYCDDTEQTLDMTQALGMAPGLASLVMYVGSTDTAIISAMTTHSPLPTTIGCSWGWTPADPSTLDPYFEKMAAQGQNFFAASGDSSTWSTRNEAWPADDAYVVSVGGTDLTTNERGRRVGVGDGVGGQRRRHFAGQDCDSVVAEAVGRDQLEQQGVDDVCATARMFRRTPISPSIPAPTRRRCLANEYGGTSFAAPMWAGYIALVNQQLAASGLGDDRVHQSDDLLDRRGQQLQDRLPRHHQRQVGQLFGGDRVRPGDRLGQSEQRPARRTAVKRKKDGSEGARTQRSGLSFWVGLDLCPRGLNR